MINFNKVVICTVGKVGSANFLSCHYSQTKNIKHSHNLLTLKNVLKHQSNCLIIVGVRNPIDRNLSYMFQSFNDKFYNDVKTKKNNYKGEYCYIEGMTDDKLPVWKNKNIRIKLSSEEIIDLFLKQNYHFTFNDWFEEFLEITNIDHFNKDRGIDFYKFPNNNTIMIYTMEKLNQNTTFIIKELGIIGNFNNRNDSKKRSYHQLYQEVKQKIIYPKDHLDKLLNTNIMKLFY